MDGGSTPTSSAHPQRPQTGRKQAASTPHDANQSIISATPSDRDRQVFAKKSSALQNTPPPSPQPRGPVSRTKGGRQIKTAFSVRKSTTTGFRGEANDAGPSRLSDSQRGGPSPFTIARPRTSLPVSSSLYTHRLKTHGRKTTIPPEGSQNAQFRRRSMITASSAPNDRSVKSSDTLAPTWHLISDEYEKILPKKRPLNEDARLSLGFGLRKRMAVMSRPNNRGFTSAQRTKTSTDAGTQNGPRGYLAHEMRLKARKGDDESESDSPLEDESSSSDSPMEQDIPQGRFGPRLVLAGRTGVKAARKREWPPPQPSDQDSDEGEPPADSSDNESDNERTAQLSSESGGKERLRNEEEGGEEGGEEGDGDGEKGREEEEEDEPQAEEEEEDSVEEVFMPQRSPSPGPPEIVFLNSPPKMIKKLSPSPVHDVQPFPSKIPSVPPDELIAAVEVLTLSSVRMQQLRLLPFMLRNLRKGFRHRCRTLGIPTKSRSGPISVAVRFEHSSDSGQHIFETRMEKWLCPLCELHGPFGTKEMLASHLEWDHAEAEFHWVDMQDETWLLQVVVFAPQPEERRYTPEAMEDTSVRRLSTPPPREAKPEEDGSYSPFPFVTLSPPRPAEDRAPVPPSLPSPLPPRIQFPEEPQTPMRATRFLRESSRSRSTAAPASVTRTPGSMTPMARSSRGRSTTTTTATTSATEAITKEGPRELSRYPTPPPASHRLGPAAQPPYLPFKSEYGGPDIYYSCRPGGATLFDLLNTLPLEPFGVLAWDVLDREDEIFDSDNVQDEYKVMHALWGRWIILNRNTFIADYYKGTVAFVDTYWRMIHRAAGWDALRYWLFMLLANRFISGHEVAKILKHYEALVGMDFWD